MSTPPRGEHWGGGGVGTGTPLGKAVVVSVVVGVVVVVVVASVVTVGTEADSPELHASINATKRSAGRRMVHSWRLTANRPVTGARMSTGGGAGRESR